MGLYPPLDQAVKPICNIWNPQDIPFVFLTSSHPTMATASTNSILVSLPSISLHACNTQLPPPGYIITISDDTAISHAHLPDIWFERSAPALQHYAYERVCSRGSSLFSHVRQRSTDSALDAICAKVPEFVSQEKGRLGPLAKRNQLNILSRVRYPHQSYYILG